MLCNCAEGLHFSAFHFYCLLFDYTAYCLSTMTFTVICICETNADGNKRHSAGSNGSIDGLVALTLSQVAKWTIAGFESPHKTILELNLSLLTTEQNVVHAG